MRNGVFLLSIYASSVASTRPRRVLTLTPRGHRDDVHVAFAAAPFPRPPPEQTYVQAGRRRPPSAHATASNPVDRSARGMSAEDVTSAACGVRDAPAPADAIGKARGRDGRGYPRKAPSPLVDIGINITNRAMRKHWRDIVRRAVGVRVETMVLTGTSLKCSRESLEIAAAWAEENGGARNLLCTVGVHPHDAKAFRPGPSGGRGGDMEVEERGTIDEMREILTGNPLAVAVGECGLDYNRNFSPREHQLHAFREQVRLACELRLPLFVHEREAHDHLVRVLDEVQDDASLPSLPPVVVHCFTGKAEEARAYVDRGFYVGFTGTVCKKERGAHLREEVLPIVPLDRIMVETDAPFMGFVKGRHRHSEPAHVVGVAEEISRVLGVPMQEVCAATTANARHFFGIEDS